MASSRIPGGNIHKPTKLSDHVSFTFMFPRLGWKFIFILFVIVIIIQFCRLLSVSQVCIKL